MKDLFGNEITVEQARVIEEHGKRKRKQTAPNGYARRPGTGPAGETCKTCAHAVRVQGGSRKFLKCAVIRHRWTHGPGTDIKAGSPACEMWEGRS